MDEGENGGKDEEAEIVIFVVSLKLGIYSTYQEIMNLTSAAPTRELSFESFSLLNVLHSDPTSITLHRHSQQCRKIKVL